MSLVAESIITHVVVYKALSHYVQGLIICLGLIYPYKLLLLLVGEGPRGSIEA